MSSEVLYRKWRPQSFNEVVGQVHVTTTLRNAVRAGRVGHAYLFSGPRGTGKTSTGRILAKAVNCLNPTDGEPCNACEACVSISDGRCLDIIEIDAASNRGIDDIRSLREKVGYAAGSVTRKVYVVDEVHMLTEAASNALLKTLEEPPPHVMFVLATTEFHKVLPTIASRCQCFTFRRLSIESILERLRLVAEREEVDVDDDSLALIARFASGSLRDAENLTQQLVSNVGRSLTVESIRAALGVSEESRVMHLVDRVVERDLAGALRVLHEANECGVDLRQFGRQVVAAFRNLLLIKGGCAEAADVVPDERAELERLAGQTAIGSLADATRLFSEASTRDSAQQLLGLELACVDSIMRRMEASTGAEMKTEPEAQERTPPRQAPRALRKDRPAAAPERVSESEASGTEGARGQDLDEGSPPRQEQVQSQNGPRHGEEVPVDDATGPAPAPPVSAAGATEEAREVTEDGNTAEDAELHSVQARWKEYVDSLRGLGSTGNLDAFLRSACEPVAIEGDVLVLRFLHAFHKNKVEEQKYRHIMENQLEKFYGRPYKVACVLQDSEGPQGKSSKAQGSRLIESAIRMGARPKR